MDPFITFNEQILESLKDIKNLEVECRFGIIRDRTFDTNISKHNYDIIMQFLESNKAWSKDILYIVDYFDNTGKRLTVSNNGTNTCIRKQKIHTSNWAIKGAPIDFRISWAVEQPFPETMFNSNRIVKQRTKQRSRFVHNCFIFELTEVSQLPDDKDEEEVLSYEVEIELDISSIEKTSHYIMHSFILKISDIMNMISENKLEYVHQV